MAEELVRAHVLLPKALVEEIDRRVGPRRRSEFVAKAAQKQIDIDDRLAAFDRFAGFLKDVDIPGWETSESAAEWVRAQRRIGIDDDPWEESRAREEARRAECAS